jgi:hypothetical protein
VTSPSPQALQPLLLLRFDFVFLDCDRDRRRGIGRTHTVPSSRPGDILMSVIRQRGTCLGVGLGITSADVRNDDGGSWSGCSGGFPRRSYASCSKRGLHEGLAHFEEETSLFFIVRLFRHLKTFVGELPKLFSSHDTTLSTTRPVRMLGRINEYVRPVADTLRHI